MSTDMVMVTAYIQGHKGSERQVEARMMNDGSKAYLKGTPVVCRFRTGNKLHGTLAVAWRQPDERYRVPATDVIHNRTCSVVGWADQVGSNSGWTF